MSSDSGGAPRVCAVLVLIAAVAGSPLSSLWASEKEGSASSTTRSDASELSEVLVVGQREQAITIEPRGLSVSLGQAQFEAINALNVEDLMKYAPNFYVRKRYTGDANAVVALRGTNTIQSARTLVLVDGFVVSNFLGNRYDFPPKWNVVGPGEVRQFDIVYGPYSARYGGNSMGGVVAVTTREPERNELFASTQLFSMPYQQYGTVATYNGHNVEAGGAWRQEGGPFSMRVSVRRQENTGQPMSFSLLTQASSGTGTPVSGAVTDPDLPAAVFGAASPDHTVQHQFRTRIGYEFADRWKADALFFYWSTDSDQTRPQTYLRDASGEPVYQGPVSIDDAVYSATGLGLSLGERIEMLAGLKLAGSLGSWDAAVNISRYWIDRQHSRSSNDYQTGITDGAGMFTAQRRAGWWTGDVTLERRFGLQKIALGVNSNQYETAQDTFRTSNWRSRSDPAFSSATYGKTRVLGLFIEDEIALGESTAVTPGVRVERWDAFDGGIGRMIAGSPAFQRYADRRETVVDSKLSLQHEAWPGWPMQLSLATSTRFPTVGELFQGRLDSVTRQLDPDSFDPGLQPEKSRDASFMLGHRLGAVRLTGSVFYQQITNAIYNFSGINAYGNVVTSYKNVDRLRQLGVEMIGEASGVFLSGLDIDGNIAWIDAKVLRNDSEPASEGVQFPRIPRWRVNGNVRYRFMPRWQASLGWRYASRPNSDLLGLKRGDTYSYISEFFFADARLSWDVTDGAQLSFGVDNLNNDRGWVSHPLPQRTFVADLKWKM